MDGVSSRPSPAAATARSLRPAAPVPVAAPREYCIGLRSRDADAYNGPLVHGDEVLAALRALCSDGTWLSTAAIRRELLRRAARDSGEATAASARRATVRRGLANDLPYVLAELERGNYLESRSTARMPGAPAFHYG